MDQLCTKLFFNWFLKLFNWFKFQLKNLKIQVILKIFYSEKKLKKDFEWKLIGNWVENEWKRRGKLKSEWGKPKFLKTEWKFYAIKRNLSGNEKMENEFWVWKPVVWVWKKFKQPKLSKILPIFKNFEWQMQSWKVFT